MHHGCSWVNTVPSASPPASQIVCFPVWLGLSLSSSPPTYFHPFSFLSLSVFPRQSHLFLSFNFELKVFCWVSCVRFFCNPMECSPPGSSVHGISQARILEWVAISFSRGSPQVRDRAHVSCIGRQFLYHWATWEAHELKYWKKISLFTATIQVLEMDLNLSKEKVAALGLGRQNKIRSSYSGKAMKCYKHMENLN